MKMFRRNMGLKGLALGVSGGLWVFVAGGGEC